MAIAVQNAINHIYQNLQQRPPRPSRPPRPKGPEGPPRVIHNNTIHGNTINKWNVNQIGFFDPNFKDNNITAGSGDITYMGNNPIIRDVFVFIERIHNLITIKGEEIIQSNLQTCLKGIALK